MSCGNKEQMFQFFSAGNAGNAPTMVHELMFAGRYSNVNSNAFRHMRKFFLLISRLDFHFDSPDLKVLP